MRSMTGSLAVKAVAAGAAVLVVAGGVGVALWSNSASSRAALAYQAKRRALDASIVAAGQQGYSAVDLAPVTAQLRTLDGAKEPWWLPGRPAYFQAQTTQVSSLQVELGALEQRLRDQAQSDGARQVGDARTSIALAQQANAADPDVQALQQRVDAVARAQGAAHTLKDYRAADDQARSVAQDAAALVTSTQQENQALAQAAQQLVAQTGGSLAAIQQAGKQAIYNANNDSSIIAYLTKEGPFKDSDTVTRLVNRLGKYAGLIGSADPDQAALGAAAAGRYGGQIHYALSAGLPAKSVIVSFQAQHAWAYQGSQVVMDTPVTTGIRGEGDFGTDFGPMKVLHKDHPWKFQSPWPKGSPHWYPDTVVQWTTFFTVTGEAFHDADWQPDSTLGPGSQFTQGLQSHGCIHLPAARAQWMYNWADVGMPVIVYPGDGSSVANQLAQITTNDKGIPHSAGG